jgi:hypothetical protein
MNVRTGASHGAFATNSGATLQGQSEAKPEATTTSSSEKKKEFDCIYGEKHRYKKCPYLVESAQPEDWSSDLAITDKVAQKLEAHEKLKNTVGFHCGKDAILFRNGKNKKKTDNATAVDSEEETIVKAHHAGFALSGIWYLQRHHWEGLSTPRYYPL